MPERDFRPAAVAVVRLVLRACGWEPVYESAKDILTIAGTLRGSSTAPPGPKQIQRAVNWAQKSLFSIFDSDKVRAPRNDINAAVLAVAELLNMQEFNDLLIRAITDSSALESYLLMNGGRNIRATLLSETAEAAFDVLLTSTCQHLAEIALSAPTFGPLALQQLLRSQVKLEAISHQIDQRLLALTDSINGEGNFAKFTSRYMARIAEQLDFLDIPGVDLARYRQRYNLTMAYIPMSVHGGEAMQFDRATLQNLLSTRKFLLVVGEPGSGKSTLLKWAAVETARSNIRLNTHTQTVPFLIKLRSLPDSLPDIDNLGAPLTEGLVVQKPSQWSTDLIESGRAILLFDGLDEVPEERREAIAKWVDQLYVDHGRRGTRIIITSRSTALQASRFRPQHAATAFLQPMPQGKVERFVRLWHRAVYESMDVASLSDWLAISDQLLARIENDTQLSRLASNPLLCAVICALYHARSHHLPSERSELYDALLAMLLSRRDQERKGIESLLSLSDTQRLAEGVALGYLRRERDELSRKDVLDMLRASLLSFRRHTVRDMRAAIVLEYFTNRTGLLREPPPSGDIDFWHKSFQEFLAARALVAQGRDEELMTHAVDAAWREVIIWACSLMTLERASLFLTRIADAVTSAPTDAHRDYLTVLALSCAHYILQLDDEAQFWITELASTLIPPIRSEQMRAITNLGPAAVPFLQEALNTVLPDRSRKAVAQEIIDALSRIGGEAANSVLAETPPGFKRDWASRLGYFWSSWGSEDYARRVLGAVPYNADDTSIGVHLRSFRQLRSIDYISRVYLPAVYISLGDLEPDALGEGSSRHISSATLTEARWEDVITFLRRYPSVAELDITLINGIESTSPDQTFSDVRTLSMKAASNALLDLDALQIFPNLKALTITGPADIHAAHGFGAIERVIIELADTSKLEISWLGNIRELTCWPWAHSSLRLLCNLSSLNKLDLSESPRLETLDGIQGLPDVSSVNVSFCEELRDIRPALYCPALTELVVEECYEISTEDLEDLDPVVVTGEDDLGRLGPDSPTPALFSDRWLTVNLDAIPEVEMAVRGWDDWSFWDEIKGDADEWITAEPKDDQEASLAEAGLVIFNSFDAWRRAQGTPGLKQRMRRRASVHEAGADN